MKPMFQVQSILIMNSRNGLNMENGDCIWVEA